MKHLSHDVQLNSYIVSCMWTIRDLPPGTLVTSGPGLLPMNRSESVVFPQSGSVLISVAHVATIDLIDVRCLGCNLWP